MVFLHSMLCPFTAEIVVLEARKQYGHKAENFKLYIFYVVEILLKFVSVAQLVSAVCFVYSYSSSTRTNKLSV